LDGWHLDFEIMQSKHPFLFWTIFATMAAVFLFGWFAYWEAKRQGLGSLAGVMKALPIAEDTKRDVSAVGTLADALFHTVGKEKTYLILFQNNLELRPGGGFIGSFGILKVKDGKVTEFSVHDTGNFDGRIPDTVEPPYPMKETLKVTAWKFRDSNWSPDFATNARQAVMFYGMGEGQERFDGVFGVTANVLASLLTVTGPVTVPGFPGTYDSRNAIRDLEYQVEKGYQSQAIDFGDRKSMMGLLGEQLIGKVKGLGPAGLWNLYQVGLEDLNRKDVQLYFTDEALEAKVLSAGWGGAVDAKWSDDFLMAVDANLNSWKSDAVMKRSYRYEVDLSGAKPKATFTVSYEHTATEKDFMTKDYQSFLRVYVPAGSWLENVTGNAKEPVFGEAFGKKYFGVLVQVPLGTKKDVTFTYDLPDTIDREFYDLKIQKQAGVNDVPVDITVITKDGTKKQTSFIMNRDFTYSRGGSSK
jgi:hypothetical protein